MIMRNWSVGVDNQGRQYSDKKRKVSLCKQHTAGRTGRDKPEKRASNESQTEEVLQVHKHPPTSSPPTLPPTLLSPITAS